MKGELLKIVSGHMLEEVLSKRVVLFGKDNDNVAGHLLKSMDEEDWRDDSGHREQRTKQARYGSMQAQSLLS